MQFPVLTVVSIIIGVSAVVGAMVVPLYLRWLRQARGDGREEAEHEQVMEAQSGIEDKLEAIQAELQEVRVEVKQNGERSERNQRHIHQLIVGDLNGTDGEIGNPHYRAEHCPLDDECPFHDPA